MSPSAATTRTAPTRSSGADHVVRVRMVNQRVAVAPIEGNAILVDARRPATRRVTAWVSTQHPHYARDLLAEALGLAKDDVRVVAPHVGGAFGGKAGIGTDHAAVALAAVRLGPPRQVDRDPQRGDALDARPRPGAVRRAGPDRRRAGSWGCDCACSASAGRTPVSAGALAVGPTYRMAQGVYDIPELRFDAVAVMTNTAPVGAFRGAGRPEAAACIERMIDVAAAELGLAPEEIRRRNFIRPDAFPFKTRTGATYDNGDYDLALTEALRMADIEPVRREQRRRIEAGERRLLGIGLATYVEITGFGGSEYGQVVVHDGRHRHGAFRHLVARPGPRDELLDDRRRPARDPHGGHHLRAVRHRVDPEGRRHGRLALAADRRQRGRQGRRRAEGEGSSSWPHGCWRPHPRTWSSTTARSRSPASRTRG